MPVFNCRPHVGVGDEVGLLYVGVPEVLDGRAMPELGAGAGGAGAGGGLVEVAGGGAGAGAGPGGGGGGGEGNLFE